MPSETRAILAGIAGARGPVRSTAFHTIRDVLGGRRVIVAVTGVGVSNGAMVAAIFIHHFPSDGSSSSRERVRG